MPRAQANLKIPYVGAASATEALLPEPSADELARERLELQNAELLSRLQHVEAALRAAGIILAPYYAKLGNGRDHD